MAEQVNGIGLNVDSGLFEVGATLPQTGSWSIGCDVTIEDVDASVQEIKVNDISLSGSLAIPEVSVDIDANNDKVMDLEIGIIASGLSTGITERQIVPYDKIVKITEFSPESINERKYASSALAAKRIYDLIKEGGAGLNEDELKAFLKKYGYVTEEYVNELLKNASNFFYLSEDGQSIGTPYNIFSEKEISANGLSVGSGGSGSGEGGGLIRTVLTSSSLGSVTSNDNFTTFNAFAIDSIYKKVKSIEEGNVRLSNYYTKSESDARFALLSSLTTVEEKIREILSWFTIDENGNLRTEFNLYSTKEISAGGFNGTGGSTGGGLISTVLGIDKFGTVTTNSNTSTFNAYAIDSLHKRIKNLEESEVDLTGYATEEWVMGRGFITASALAPYLKTSDFETWKTGSFNPVVSQVNTNKNNIAEILRWFAIDGDGNLYTTYNFYSTKEISSGGFDSGSNGTGGLIGVVYGKSSFGTIANEANNATFNAYAIDSLYKRIVSLENKEVDLTGYATEAWVAGQGFITSAALSPYMKTADANNTFATKTALNNLSSSHDSLASRVSTAEGNISTHTTQISGLTTRMGNAESNISTNAKGIADNKTAIATNKNNISANATAITNLGKRVTTNERNIAEIFKWFAVDSDGNLYTTYNFYSTKEISANGLSVGSGGSGGGLISQVFGTTAFGTIASESNSATFNAYAIDSLYKRIVSLEGKATAVSFVPSLTSGKQIGTISIDGVSTVLYGVDAYSKTEADGTFLKLSGGTIEGTLMNPLTIKTSAKEVGIPMYVNGVVKMWVGWQSDNGTYLYSSAQNAYLGIKDNGTPHFNGNTLLHSGNIGSFKAGGLESEYLVSLDNAGYNKVFSSGFQATNRPSENYATGLTLYNTELGYTYQLAYSTTGGIFSRYKNGTTWSAWNTLLHSNNYSQYALPLTGGTITGSLNVLHNSSVIPLLVENKAQNYTAIAFRGANSNTAYLVYSGTGDTWEVTNVNWTRTSALLHANNYSQYALPLSGGKVSGEVKINGKSTLAAPLIIETPSMGYSGYIQFTDGSTELGWLGFSNKVAVIRQGGANSTIIHSGNYNSYSPKLDGTGASGTWGISISGNAKTLNTSAYPVINANEVSYTDCAVRFLSAIANTSTNLPTSTGYQNGMLVLPLHDNGSTAQMYFSKGDEHFYYRSLHTGAWKTIAFTDSNVASATKLATARTIWGQSFDGTGNVTGAIKTPSGYNAVTILDSYLVLGQGMAENSLPTYLDGYNVYMRYGKSSTIGVTLNSSGNVGIGTTSPAYKLDVNGSGRFTGRVYCDDELRFSNTSTCGGYFAAGADGTYAGIYTANKGTWQSSNIYLHNNGNVTMANDFAVRGATTLQSTLSVTGAVTMDSSLNVGTVINVGSNIMPKTTETSYLGSTSLRFLAVCAKVADFSGKVTANYLSVSYDGLRFSDNANYALFMDSSNKVNLSGYYGINLNGAVTMSSTLHVVGVSTFESYLNIQAGIRPNADNARYVGTSSYRFNEGYINNMYTNAVYVGKGTTYGFVSDGSITATTIYAKSGIKISSGQALTFLDASGKEHKLTYDSTAGAFKFDGNILVTGDGQFNAIN